MAGRYITCTAARGSPFTFIYSRNPQADPEAPPMRKTISRSVQSGLMTLVIYVGSIAPASAAPIFWTDWMGANSGAVSGSFTATGTITTPTSTVGVTYTNPQGVGFYQASSGTDWWTDNTHVVRDPATSPFTSPAVDNIPPGVDM